MDEATLGMEASFAQWAELTDAYARQLTAMQLGVAGARDEATRLAREIQQLVRGPVPPGDWLGPMASVPRP
ncbi:hypothetical protein [Xenophilus sp.]|uniref:hypothetical protein n=1 Tax=Xenophilus sp. TaxID=1873499 RepID=UPI0037DCBCFE